MSADIGRSMALLLAVVLCVTGPLFLLAERTGQNEKYALQQVVDEFTAKVRLTESVTLGDYEEMLAALARTGAVCSIEMFIGKKISEISEGNPAGTPLRCGLHVHTPACFKGHNHNASGCIYHVHSKACYCQGKLTDCYKTEHWSYTCGSCGGSGSATSTQTCGACSGAGGQVKTIKCSCKGGMIGAAKPCGSCGGSGIKSGQECSKCGGTGNVDTYLVHSACGGAGTLTDWYLCSACRGSGSISTTVNCGSCFGSGTVAGSINYYRCELCGNGSTTSRGQFCGIKQCVYTSEGYLCGIDENDTDSMCNLVMVDADYANEQVLPAGSSLADIDNRIFFTFLDGSVDICNAEIVDIEGFVPDKAGEYTIRLKSTGYFLDVDSYETRFFPVKIVVREDKKAELKGIRVVDLSEEYHEGEPLNIEVYAVFEDGERMLDPSEYWDTYDDSIPGKQIVMIGYENYVTQIEVVVAAEALDPEETEDIEGSPDGTSSGEGSADGEELPGSSPGLEENDSEESGSEESDNEQTGNGQQDDEDPDNGQQSGEQPGYDKPDTSDDLNKNNPEERIRAGYEEMIGTDELLEMLYQNARIELEEGDIFSIIVHVTQESFSEKLGLFGKKKEEKYTSGVMIG